MNSYQNRPPVMMSMTERSAAELADWAVDQIRSHLEVSKRPFVMALSGAQGSGKSTQSALWASQLKAAGHPGLVLSLDDFYLSKVERQALGTQVHPLAETRGPPGTHDTQRLVSVIRRLSDGTACEVALPRFSKADDDRVSDSVQTVQPLDWVIVEGWCLGISKADKHAEEENTPIYRRPNIEHWRYWVQSSIDSEWCDLDALFDWIVYLRIPEFESIVDARWRQEETLMRETGRSQFTSRDEVREFVSLYEPWTLRMADYSRPWAHHAFEVCPNYRYRELTCPESDSKS